MMDDKALNVYNVHHRYLDMNGVPTSESTFLRALKRFNAWYCDHDKGNTYRRARSTPNNLRYLTYYLTRLIELFVDITQTLVFVDESWIVANMHRKKFWAMLIGDTIVSRDYKPGKGARGIVIGALARFGRTEEGAEPWYGMVPNASKIWDPSPNKPYVFPKPDSPPRCKDKQDMNSAMKCPAPSTDREKARRAFYPYLPLFTLIYSYITTIITIITIIIIIIIIIFKIKEQRGQKGQRIERAGIESGKSAEV